MKWFSSLLVCAVALSACSLSRAPRSPGDVIAQSLESSVQLSTERDGGKRRWGSGVVLSVDQEGRALILTTAHLVEPPVEQSVFVHGSSNGDRVEAQILTVDPELDVAVLEASGLEVEPAHLKSSARLGDSVWVVSFPWGRRGTVVNGYVSQIAEADGNALIPIEGPVGLIDAAVSYGTSGGGVFDGRTGRLVGIVRGYRTARLALPGPEKASLELPIAGETTVIPTSEILCLLSNAQLGDRIEADIPACSRI